MKARCILTGALLAVALLSGCSSSARSVSGVFTDKYYHEDGDYTSMVLWTEDGEQYAIDDCVAPLGAVCEVFFDTKGTDTTEDDTIVRIDCTVFEG